VFPRGDGRAARRALVTSLDVRKEELVESLWSVERSMDERPWTEGL
jgi:hypothetical protein